MGGTMRRIFTIITGGVLLMTLAVAPVGAKSFGLLYAEGGTYRTFGTPAHVAPGTGTDPIYAFENSMNDLQHSVARYAPGPGSHGGRWAVHHVTWTIEADRNILVKDYGTLAKYIKEGRLTDVRDEDADFRCPILPNG